MPSRTLSKTVTFARPFALEGIDGLIPAGSYTVDTDEETIDSLSFVAWLRVATFITVGESGETKIYRIDPHDLEASLANDSATRS